MSELIYTTPESITDKKVTVTPPNPYLSGYGGKIPSRYMLQIGKRWRRVYIMQYGNGGSPYVLIGGIVHHLDIDTTYDLQEL